MTASASLAAAEQPVSAVIPISGRVADVFVVLLSDGTIEQAGVYGPYLGLDAAEYQRTTLLSQFRTPGWQADFKVVHRKIFVPRSA